ncbi:MAG: GSCFA domain-containing protein [Flavobacteriaceae bacterium]
MNFRTPVPIQKPDFQIDYKSNIFSVGSCFAESMAQKLSYFMFDNLSNPFGILFHPLAIEKILHKVINEISFTENDIFFHNDLYHSFDVHSQFSHPDKDVLVQNLNQKLSETKIFLEKSNYIIITLGTSWICIVLK